MQIVGLRIYMDTSTPSEIPSSRIQKLLFSTDQINQFAEIIRNGRMKGNIQQRIEHIKSINNNISSQRQCEIDNICPRCGNSLVCFV